MIKQLCALSLLVILSACGKPVVTTGGEIPFGTTNFSVTAPNSPKSYSINGLENPTLKLQRNITYIFNVNSPGHPFFIMNTQGTNTANAYSNGVTNQGIEAGTLIFTVPANAPAVLYYDSSDLSSLTGMITIVN